MKLSVIIVNYNVRAFLEQCLYSLQPAFDGLEAEIWVVDNASKDDSVACLQKAFPGVKWILNTQNLGFSKANNQALEKVTGEFVLFLNPDTLVPEDCLKKCLDFMHNQPEAGALGVKMLDGGAHYLPESKRGYPGLFTSFCKITGLHHLFPTSGLFARYYMGHLPAEKNNPVEVLAGAFMLVRKQVLEVTGGFDERFFMYGEDIDLSYRINHTPLENKNGYWKTWYFADTSIIHFKGESTKKGSLNYVVIFYKAMIQFVQKHYASGPAAGLFRILIYLAIAFRAVVSGISRVLGLLIGLFLWVIQSATKSLKSRNSRHYIEFTSLTHCTIVGALPDFERIMEILSQHNHNYVLQKERLIASNKASLLKMAGTWESRQTRAKEAVIFCPEQTVRLQDIMAILKPNRNIAFAFHYPGSKSIVGSNDKNKAGETFTISCESKTF